MSRRFLLIADDYALSPGVSRGIRELIEAGRLSGTGAMTTEPGWAADAPALLASRDRTAIGLHLNLTTASPLAPMPQLAPDGHFPGLRTLLLHSLSGRLDAPEIAAEIGRQLDRFEAMAGMAPDYVDGHHHVQALPTVRAALLQTMAHRYSGAMPLLRDPSDAARAILGRRRSRAKALFIAGLSKGLRRQAERLGIPTNRGFAGFSDFDRNIDFNDELADFRRFPGERPLIMCHPGYPDSTLRALDPLSDRRRDELETLRNDPTLPGWLAHLARGRDGRIDWSRA